MLAFFNSFIFILAGGGDGFYAKYLNFPGFEAWKFLNLAIFVGILVYLLKKPLSSAFKAKREQIRAELIKAEEEKQAALAQLTATEAKIANLEAERTAVLEKAKIEAAAEKARLADQTAFEVKRLREQSEAEITRLSKQSFAELRRFSAEESIRIAEEKLKTQMNAEKDAQLVKAGIQAIGGMN